MNLTILGPNLPGNLQDKGSIHVHAAGCADLKRGSYRHVGKYEQDTGEYDSRQAVVESFYGPEAGSFYEESGIPEAKWDTAWEDEGYEAEFYWAPCTNKLPRNRVTPNPPLEPKAEPVAEQLTFPGPWIVTSTNTVNPMPQTLPGENIAAALADMVRSRLDGITEIEVRVDGRIITYRLDA